MSGNYRFSKLTACNELKTIKMLEKKYQLPGHGMLGLSMKVFPFGPVILDNAEAIR